MFNHLEIEKTIGYVFKNKDILKECFTHPSYLNSINKSKRNDDYDRLEFLGDSVLGLIVSDFLFKNKNKSEGDMTEEKKKIVSSKPLAKQIKILGLDEHLLVGNNTLVTDNMCENLFEAIVGGIYLDGGFEKASKFVYQTIIKSHQTGEGVKDFKSTLNEYIYKNHLPNAEYRILEKMGEDNSPTFIVGLNVGHISVTGTGKSKKSAEQAAAHSALKIINKDGK